MIDSEKNRDLKFAERSGKGASFVANKDFVERVRAMSSRERVAFLVSAGINDADGKLTDRYRD